MKYAQILDMNMVPEWRNQYLDYRALDAALNRAIENKNIKSREKGVDLYYELIKLNQKFAIYFNQECQNQLDKINAFHKEKLSEMKGKYNNLQDQLDQVLSSPAYREIQPESSLLNEQREADSYTVTSISELFKNIKGKIGMRPEFMSNTIGCHQQSSSDWLNILPKANKISIFGESSTSSMQTSKERMTTLARKLSESFTNSAQRISNNFHVLSDQQAPVRFNGRSRTSASGSQLMDGYFHSGYNNSPEIDIPHLQTLASTTTASSQSKKDIAASYKNKITHLKFAFRELYFNLVLFEQYTQLNYNGFEQILRKHDRMFASTLGRKFYQEHVQTADFYNDLQTIDHLIEGVEHVYTLHFENGNRRKAIEKLQVPSNVYKPSSPMLDFRVGYELGMFAVLFILVLLVGFFSDTGYDWRTVFRLYRSPLVLIIFLFQFGISIVIWKHYKINHVLIFELNPRNNLSFHHFLEFGSLLGIIWSISVLLFLFSERYSIRPSLCPLVVVIIIVSYLFNPTATCHYQARFWLIRILVSHFMQSTELTL